MTQQEFINTIAPIFQKYAKKYGYKIVSAAIAQACLESAYGTSYKAMHGNNLLGLKYRPNRVKTNNGYFKNGGSEQNPDGTYTQLPSNTAWYSFDDYDHCIEGYYQFISIPNYSKVKETNTALEYLHAIKNAGYATSLSYVQNVYKVVEKWNLTKYDNFEPSSLPPQSSVPALEIIQRTSTHNTTSCNNRKIEWIVVHYTAGTTSTRGTAQNTAAYFSKTPSQASADFIVDDETIVQYNPDPLKHYCWAVGGNKYSNKFTTLSGQYYGKCKNSNSISIEICSNKKNKSSLAATDNDWFITEKSENMAIQLIRYLLQLYKIDKKHIIMHHQVTGKMCPQPWCKNENALVNWNNFLSKIDTGNLPTVSTKPSIPAQDIISGGTQVRYVARVTANKLNVRSGPGTMYSIVQTISKGEAFTIIEEQDQWGRLFSGRGWVSLHYMEKVEQKKKETIEEKEFKSYLVKIIADKLNVREDPNANSKIISSVRRPAVYAIIEEKDGWGHLRSINGWICLKYTEKVE